MKVAGRTWVSHVALVCALGIAQAQGPLQSPWDVHPVAVSAKSYSCPTVKVLPKDIAAADFYSDAKHSIIDPEREAAYKAASAVYTDLSRDAEKAADEFQKTGSAQAAACVMKLLDAQAQAQAMTGSMSTNQANYVQNWTLGALAVTYLKVRTAGVPVEQKMAVDGWMKTVAQQVESYFQERREKKTKDGQNNHLYWAGFSVMAAGIAGE